MSKLEDIKVTIGMAIAAVIIVYFIFGIFWAVLALGAIILAPIVSPIVRQYI